MYIYALVSVKLLNSYVVEVLQVSFERLHSLYQNISLFIFAVSCF